MIDQGDLPKPQEVSLTPEQKTKTDKDISTLSALSSYAASHGGLLEVSGGYAVEAHFGGRMTRPHGDIDAVLWLASESQEESARVGVANILLDEPTAWAEYPNIKDRPHFIDFREVAPDKEFDARRRLELYMFDRKGMRPLVEKILVDSEGKEHKVMVTTVEEIVSDKVRILNRTEEEKKNKRVTRQTDIDELKRIINHKDFDKDKYLRARAGAIRFFNQTITEEQALEIAEQQWQVAMRAIGYSQQGSL